MLQLMGFAINTGFQHLWWKETDQFLVQRNNSVTTFRLGCDQLSGHAGQTGRSLSLAVTFSLLSSTALTFLSLSLHSLSLFLCWGPEGSRLAQQDSCRQTRLISTTAPVQSVSNSLSGELTRRAAGPAAILTHWVWVCVCVWERKRKRKRMTQEKVRVWQFMCRSPLCVYQMDHVWWKLPNLMHVTFKNLNELKNKKTVTFHNIINFKKIKIRFHPKCFFFSSQYRSQIGCE